MRRLRTVEKRVLLIFVFFACTLYSFPDPTKAAQRSSEAPWFVSSSVAADDGDVPVHRRRYRHALSINPFKLLLGLVNVSYEHRLSEQVGVFAFTEYLVGGRMDQHPDWVTKVGGRFYPGASTEQLDGGGIGLNAGFVWSHRDTGRDRGVFAGTDVGYRFVVGERFFVVPRGVVHILLSERRIRFGIEGHVGVLF